MYYLTVNLTNNFSNVLDKVRLIHTYFLALDEMILNSMWQNLMKRVVRTSY